MKLKKRLDSMVKEGWLISQVHPTLDLTIYNYSQKTQYQKYWTEETLMARGLVLNSKGNIVARPFPKFFNAAEVADQIPNTEFEVYEKEDGSLGIFFWYAVGEELHPVFASRGSFTSEQAVMGWKFLQRFPYHSLAYGYTYMFEIIYPENKIVVNYDGAETVVLLGIIQTATGREINWDSVKEHLGKDFDLVKKYSYTDSWQALQAHNTSNREGYVLRYSNGFRVKVKFDDYVKLHRLVTNLTPLKIWETLSTEDKSEWDKLYDSIPDEWFAWFNEQVSSLKKDYEDCKNHVLSFYEMLMASKNTIRKDQAVWIIGNVPSEYRFIMFLLLDGKEWSQQIWKLVKPKN